MGMGIIISGFRPPDAIWHRMKAVWDACEAAGVPCPKEVNDFFDNGVPDPSGVEVDLSSTDDLPDRWYVSGSRDDEQGSVSPYDDRDSVGVEINLERLPAGLRIVRIAARW